MIDWAGIYGTGSIDLEKATDAQLKVFGKKRIFHAEGREFETEKELADALGIRRPVSRVWDYINDPKFKTWWVEIVDL